MSELASGIKRALKDAAPMPPGTDAPPPKPVSEFAPKAPPTLGAADTITAMIERITKMESFERSEAACSLLNVFIAAVQRTAGRSYLTIHDWYAYLNALEWLERITNPSEEKGNG